MATWARSLRFVQEYLKDFNGTQAAIRAGYSPKSAHVQANRLLKSDKVQALLRQAMMDEDEIRLRIADLAKNAKSESVRLKALELAGKAKGVKLFDDVVEHDHKVRILWDREIPGSETSQSQT